MSTKIAKPASPARDTISPSDLTFGLSTCKRCLWIKYWFKITMPGQFPLVKPLSAAQEEHFRRASMPDLDPNLAPGVVKQWGQWVKSAPIEVDGKPTRWRILGIYDLLAHYDDGSVGIIDCKVSDSERDNAHGFGVTQHYLHVTRDQAQFNSLISDLIEVIEGDLPEAGPECDTCNYLVKRLAIEGN